MTQVCVVQKDVLLRPVVKRVAADWVALADYVGMRIPHVVPLRAGEREYVVVYNPARSGEVNLTLPHATIYGACFIVRLMADGYHWADLTAEDAERVIAIVDEFANYRN